MSIGQPVALGVPLTGVQLIEASAGTARPGKWISCASSWRRTYRWVGSSPSPSRAPRPPSCASASRAGSARCSTSWRAAGPTMGCASFSPRGSPTPDARDSSCARPCTASTCRPLHNRRLLPAGAVRPGVRERHALRDRGPGRCQRVARRGGCGLLAPTDRLAAHRTGRRPGSPPP